MRKILSLACLLGFIAFFCFSCGEHTYLCPYQTLKWSKEKVQTSEGNEVKSVFDLGGQLDSYLRRVGKGSLNAEIKNEISYYSDKINSGSIEYDIEFVKRWNALVTDLCGKLALFSDEKFSSSSRLELEQEVLLAVKSFYRNLTEYKLEPVENQDKNLITEPVPEKPKDNMPKDNVPVNKMLEISIHIDDNHKGYSNVLVDGKQAKILPASTPSNLRILVGKNPNEKQKILIITEKGDTCEIFKLFDNEDLPIRLIPNCKTKNLH